MTIYELVELRTMIGERLVSAIKFWLSVTFAVFATAFYAGAKLDGFSIAVLLVFYGVNCLTISMLIRMLGGQLKALVKDSEAQLEQASAPLNILQSGVLQPPSGIIMVMHGMVFSGLATYPMYLLKVAT
jgi:hypothetical protein